MAIGAGTGGSKRRAADAARVNQKLDSLISKLDKTSGSVKQVTHSVQDLGDGVRETLAAMEKLGIIKDALRPTQKAIEAAEMAFSDFNTEVDDASSSVERYLRDNKTLVQELKGMVTEQEALEKVQKKRTKATKEDTAAMKALGSSMKEVLESVKALKNAMHDGGINVKINNEGFTRVLNEMSDAVKNFKRRKGNKNKNFFDAFIGSREENQQSTERVLSEARDLKGKMESALSDGMAETLEKKLSNAIARGINKGIESGLSTITSIDPTAKMVGALLNETNASQMTKSRVLQSLLGKTDETAIRMERIKQNARNRLEYRKIEAEKDIKMSTAASVRQAEMQYLDANPNTNSGRMLAARAKRAEVELQREQLKLEKELADVEQKKTNRIRNQEEGLRIQKEMNEVIGKEGSQLRKLGEDLVMLNAKRREYLTQGDELNKINFAEVANNARQITKKTKEWAAELYRVQHHYHAIERIGKATVNVIKSTAAIFQTTSATLSAASGLFSTLRTKATGFFKFFTNGFRRVFAYARSMATSLFNSGVEQREKIERAQIGFKAFFGEERVPEVTSAVRREAAKTPIVNAGDLANYVMQLAPVAQGNASLALNSSLGILKSLVYSGSDISEGEYVIKNIRDVIAKGKATAIDIRQFNRALPGLEKAISQMPDLANFLNEEGKLNITKENVGRVLDVFATLNKDENSPLKQIEKDQLQTLQGMKQLFEEKKTTAMESILQKSGVFDLLYDILGVATDDSMWNKVVDFVSRILQPLVTKVNNWLNNVNWTDLGNKLSKFWGIIKEGINAAKETVLSTGKRILNTSDMNAVFERIAKIISSFIRGVGNGIAAAMEFAQWAANLLSGGDLEKLAENIGKWLVSPLGKIVQTLLGLGTNAFGMASRALSTLAKLIDGAVRFAKWIINGNALKFGSNYANMYANSGSFANSMATNVALAAGGTAKLSGKTNVSVRQAGAVSRAVNTATTSVQTFGTAVKAIGSRLLRGISAGGIISLIGSAVGEAIKGMKLFGNASEDIGNAVQKVSEALMFIVIGASVGGVTGGLIGAGAFLVKALVDIGNEIERERKERYDQNREIILNKAKQQYADTAMAILGDKGVNTDTGSDAGKYAYERMKKWLDESDLSRKTPEAIANEAADVFAEALKFKNVARAITEVGLSDAYKNAGGNRVDLGSEQWAGKRNSLAEKIKYYRLLGDSADYGGMSNESILKQFLGGDSITDKQIDLYMVKFGEYETSMAKNTTDITDNLSTLSEKSENLKQSIDKLNTTIGELRDEATENEKKNGYYNAMFPETELGIDQKKKIKEWDKADDYIYNDDYFIDGMKVYHSDIQEAFASKLESLSSKMMELKEKGLSDSEEYKKLQEQLASIVVDYHFWASGQYQQVGQTVEKMKEEYTWFGDELKKKVEEDYEIIHHQFLWWGWDEKRRKKAAGGVMGAAGGGWNHGGVIKPIYRATGGALGVDTVPAMLQPGEFIMRRSAVSKAGLSTMFALNRGDMATAARSLGARFSGNYNNSRNWSNTINNNQRTQTNYIKVLNRNTSSRLNSYYGLANRIALS